MIRLSSDPSDRPSAGLGSVTATDRTMLRAIARRLVGIDRSDPSDPVASFRHPSNDEYWERLRDVERTAARLGAYLASGAMTIDLVAPGADDDSSEVEVHLVFADGLDPILVPWSELDLTLEPSPKPH